ncbi:hypothetical protein VNI00_005689 [Paramarasmius palmivorus]|uniref:Ubiquitin-like domain-containing protein n=1 Tax=Paramarasmius palmivorus TaxID=297713 RepID=A0AAW0DES0_9AGAR
MSLVQLRVELPTYAHSFTIQVPEIYTIRDVKQEIFNACPGAPQVSGQRIVWRGRYLSDEEKLEDLWKSPNEPRIIHLSVHPSAWTSKPPNADRLKERETQSSIPSSSISSVPTQDTPSRPPPVQSPVTRIAPTPTTSPTSPASNHPLAYILAKHKHALRVLMQDGSSHDVSTVDIGHLRSAAVHFVEGHGYQWPAILDEPFPSGSDGGLKYERTVVDGKPYLKLRNPEEAPSASQSHALKVLSYTFPLLKLPPQAPQQPSAVYSEPIQLPPNVNVILQQLGLPPVQGGPDQPQHPFLGGERANVVEVREINLRPFLLPLFMLTFRTLLLLYFVAPARKPVFGFLIVAWILYEIWQPVRNGILRGWQRAVAAEEQERNRNAARDGQNAAPANAPDTQRPNQPPAPRIGANGGSLLDTFANHDIQQEEDELLRGDAQEPGFRRKAAVFVTLFLGTVHPAVWNRRRAALRPREGRIRTEANAMNQQEETDDAELNARRAETRAALIAQHARRQPWIQNYINRVVQGEWVDDSD